MGPASSDAGLFDYGLTDRARSILFAKDLQIIGVVASVSFGIYKVLKGGAAD